MKLHLPFLITVIVLAYVILLLSQCEGQVDVVSEAAMTRYPILLVHGVGVRENVFGYKTWGRAPKALRSHGAKVFYSHTSAWTTHEENAGIIYKRVLAIKEKTGAEKVNIIAVSKGGLESRYMITMLEGYKHVASLTTLGTPHAGTSAADVIMENIGGKHTILEQVLKLYAFLLGDTSPKPFAAGMSLTREHMYIFNSIVTNVPSVRYYSYAFVVNDLKIEPFLAPTYNIVKSHEGVNDGLVPLSSALWGDEAMVVGTNGAGVSHFSINDAASVHLSGFDLPKFYIDVANMLKRNGH